MNDLLIKYLRNNENNKNEILNEIEKNNFYIIYIDNKIINIEYFNNIYEFIKTNFYNDYLNKKHIENKNIKNLEKITIYNNEIRFNFYEILIKSNIEFYYNKLIYVNKNINKNYYIKFLFDLKNLFNKDIIYINENLKSFNLL